MSDESRRSDELVSAYLDGEATPAEVAEVEGDDVLLARVEQLRAVRDAVAAPVPPMSAEQCDRMTSAALEVADAEAAERREAKIVPLHRPRQTLLAVAAATIVLAAVVGAGLIASRGSDDSTETAADAPAALDSTAADAPAALDSTADMSQASPADEEPMAEAEADDTSRASPTTTMRTAEADMAMAEASADDEMAEEAPMAEEGAIAEPESQMEAPAEAAEPTAGPADGDAADGDADDGDADDGDADDGDAADAERETEEERRAGSTTDATESDSDGPAQQVVDLGTLEDLESLFDGVGARRSAAPDGAMADPGACSVAVHEHVLESSTEPLESFIATVGTADPLTIDAQLARRADGTAFIAYAATPACEIDIHELGTLDGP